MADLGEENRAEAMSDLGHRVEDHRLSELSKEPELDSTTEPALHTTSVKEATKSSEKESGEITSRSPTREEPVPVLHSTPHAPLRD